MRTFSTLLLTTSLACAGTRSSERAPTETPRTNPASSDGVAATVLEVAASKPVDPDYHELRVGGSILEVWFDAPAFELGEAGVLDWVERAAKAVEAFYGVFPVQRARVRIDDFDGRGVRHGRVVVFDLPTVLIGLGTRTQPEHLQGDWRMTHELVHMAFPSVPSRHHWIEEGLATFIEPIARARVGWLTEEDVWREWITSMHQGQPGLGDKGLDHTHTWGRTYWGGALFGLVAEVEIRKRTANRHGLEDALRAINRAGGNIGVVWQLKRALTIADEHLGAPVLVPLYEKMAHAAVEVDLEALWEELGVTLTQERVQYDENAPLAELRRSMIRAAGAPPSTKPTRTTARLADALR